MSDFHPKKDGANEKGIFDHSLKRKGMNSFYWVHFILVGGLAALVFMVFGGNSQEWQYLGSDMTMEEREKMAQEEDVGNTKALASCNGTIQSVLDEYFPEIARRNPTLNIVKTKNGLAGIKNKNIFKAEFSNASKREFQVSGHEILPSLMYCEVGVAKDFDMYGLFAKKVWIFHQKQMSYYERPLFAKFRDFEWDNTNPEEKELPLDKQ